MRSLTVAALVALLLAEDSAFAAGVKGKVTFSGKSTKGEAVKMSADPKCQAQHKAAFFFEPIQTAAKGELANVFVYVKSGLQGKKFDVPKDAKTVLKQEGCWYYPRVSGIMVGQDFQILNNDPTMHNVNAQPDFNAAMPAAVKQLVKSFKKPKVMFKIKCNVHPWMTTYVGVLDHPYYAVTGKDGAFEIKGLPAGKYTLEAWHEKLGSATQEVTVQAAGATADFKFPLAKGKQS